MKIGKLCIISNSKNFERIKAALTTEKPEIPEVIEIQHEALWLGVSPNEKNSIIIRHGEAAISRKHCLIQWELTETGKDRWYLMDYSSNGTFLNTERVPRDSKTYLAIGDVLVFGDYSASALRYKFLITTKENNLKRPSCESHVTGSLMSSIRREKKTPSVSSATTGTGSLHSAITMEIPELFNYIYSLIDPVLEKNEELLCGMCQKICLFPIYFPCFHSFCFLCYSQKIFEKKTYCPHCQKKISKKHYPYRNYLLIEAIEKKLEPEVLCVLRLLDEKVSDIERLMQNQLRAKVNAENIIEMQSQLPIYSAVWSDEHESQFKESFSQLTKEEQIEKLVAKGLSLEFIRNADEEKIDLVLERLLIFQPHLQVKKKRKILEELLRKV